MISSLDRSSREQSFRLLERKQFVREHPHHFHLRQRRTRRIHQQRPSSRWQRELLRRRHPGTFLLLMARATSHRNRSATPPSPILDLFPTLTSGSRSQPSRRTKFSMATTSSLFSPTDTPLPHRELYWHFPSTCKSYKKNDLETRDPLFRTRPGSVIRSGELEAAPIL